VFTLVFEIPLGQQDRNHEESFIQNCRVSNGVGVKAGTLGIGVEGTWRPLPYLDVRLGANQYDYSDNGIYGGVNYDAEINLDNYYVTGNFRFPLSPFRLTGGLYSNGNEFNAVSGDNGALYSSVATRIPPTPSAPCPPVRHSTARPPISASASTSPCSAKSA
jgi:hypothetical protein